MGLEFQFYAEGEEPELEHDDEADEFQSEEGEERTLKVRLDKWLWAARFFKTRALARAAVENGKVFYNGQRSKPSREIEVGALLQVRHGRFEKTVFVRALSTRRRSTEEALQLFEETEESKQLREETASFQPPAYNPYRAQGASHYSSNYPQDRERRSVRFLRRSFGRDEQQPPREEQRSPYGHRPSYEQQPNAHYGERERPYGQRSYEQQPNAHHDESYEQRSPYEHQQPLTSHYDRSERRPYSQRQQRSHYEQQQPPTSHYDQPDQRSYGQPRTPYGHRSPQDSYPPYDSRTPYGQYPQPEQPPAPFSKKSQKEKEFEPTDTE